MYPLAANLSGPDGSVWAYTFPRNSWVPVERLEGDLAWVRVWNEKQGYLYGAVWRAGLDLSPAR